MRIVEIFNEDPTLTRVTKTLLQFALVVEDRLPRYLSDSDIEKLKEKNYILALNTLLEYRDHIKYYSLPMSYRKKINPNSNESDNIDVKKVIKYLLAEDRILNSLLCKEEERGLLDNILELRDQEILLKLCATKNAVFIDKVVLYHINQQKLDLLRNLIKEHKSIIRTSELELLEKIIKIRTKEILLTQGPSTINFSEVQQYLGLNDSKNLYFTNQNIKTVNLKSNFKNSS